MPFSHHSHSGQFCPGHAHDQLEEIVRTAIGKKMLVFGMTEHMPRAEEDLYPEEIESGNTLAAMVENQAAYYHEARRMQQKYGSQIHMPVGFEIDWCRPESLALIEQTLADHPYDYFLGSVHHVKAVPIDYDQAMYQQARDLCGGTEEATFEQYFDEQLDMLQKLRPPIVAHFDLIRLKSDEPNRKFSEMPGVWSRVLRNLDFIVGYGGLVEINTAALRKGLAEPYPSAEICQEFVKRGGRFCLSDDSHGMDQVATNFDKVPAFLEKVSITSLYYLRITESPAALLDTRFPQTEILEMSLDSVKAAAFWKTS